MQQPDEPVVLLENQFSGEENRVRKFLADVFAQPRDPVYDVGAEPEISRGCHVVAVAKINEELQCCVCFLTHLFDCATTAVGMRVHGARIDEHEILEVVGEHLVDLVDRIPGLAMVIANVMISGRLTASCLPPRLPEWRKSAIISAALPG
ncbi:MAG: hypothetical protein H7244_08800 [Herminiimonas sp.]|nr:hypothetical protein [Herminiimonas sp.]